MSVPLGNRPNAESAKFFDGHVTHYDVNQVTLS
jgi:hypothetical protein